MNYQKIYDISELTGLPRFLYHATLEKNVKNILRDGSLKFGCKPSSRRFYDIANRIPEYKQCIFLGTSISFCSSMIWKTKKQKLAYFKIPIERLDLKYLKNEVCGYRSAYSYFGNINVESNDIVLITNEIFY